MSPHCCCTHRVSHFNLLRGSPNPQSNLLLNSVVSRVLSTKVQVSNGSNPGHLTRSSLTGSLGSLSTQQRNENISFSVAIFRLGILTNTAHNVALIVPFVAGLSERAEAEMLHRATVLAPPSASTASAAAESWWTRWTRRFCRRGEGGC